MDDAKESSILSCIKIIKARRFMRIFTDIVGCKSGHVLTTLLDVCESVHRVIGRSVHGPPVDVGSFGS